MILRDPIYKLADITVESVDGPLEQTTDKVIEALTYRLGASEQT